MSHPAIAEGNTAVITGGASGIGLATAQALAARGMQICLADIDETALEEAAATIDQDVHTVATDVSSLASVEALRDSALERFGRISVVMNNAGRGGGGGPYKRYEGWQQVLAVNLWGVINGVHAFVPHLLEQGGPAAVINTGSKQGITNPPGDAAYNVSKAGVKALTESLAHELRNTEGCQVSAHLLVPGFTYTGLIRRHIKEKPAAAWWPEQVAEFLLGKLDAGDFYAICPDNDVTEAMDAARLQWNTDDVKMNRPALSRWHPDYAAEYEAFMDRESK